jgi:hypothetical protein
MPPVVLLTGAGAGDSITLLLDVDEPTSVVLAMPLSNEARGGSITFVVDDVGPADEGAIVEESRGGLGSFETVAYILSLFILGLDLELEGVLSSIELLQVSDSFAVGVEVGGQSSVILLVSVFDESVGVGGLAVEKFSEPGGQGREGSPITVTRGGIDGAGELLGVGSSQRPDDPSGVPRTLADVGGDVVVALQVSDDEVGDAVVVPDVAIGGFVRYRSLGIKFGLESVDGCSIEIRLVGEVGAAGFGCVGEGDSDVFGILESDGRVGEKGQGGARRQADFVLPFQRLFERLEDATSTLGRGGVVDDGSIDVSDGADGVFVDKDGKVARQVTKSLSGGVGLVVDLDAGLRGVGHAEELVMDERMDVLHLVLGFLCECGSPNGFFR